jgi:hypothetical protein
VDDARGSTYGYGVHCVAAQQCYGIKESTYECRYGLAFKMTTVKE